MRQTAVVVALLGLATTNVVQAFCVTPSLQTLSGPTTTQLRDASSSSRPNVDEDSTNVVEQFLQDEFPSFHSLVATATPTLWTTLAQATDGGVTLFAPTDAAIAALGETKLRQLRDVRNAETVEKLVQYHVVVQDAVSAARLRTEDWTAPAPVAPGAPRPITVRGLVTLSGDVPVGRELEHPDSGLLASILPRSDPENGTGDVVIGPRAKIQQSYKLMNGTVIVHAVDALVSPDILWRYCDQLQIRIPGI